MSFLQAVPAGARLGLAVCLASALAAPAAAQQAGELGFDIMEFEISGNTALPTAAVEQAVMPFLGPQRGMAQVEAARAALERAYQQAGFLTVLVDVPEQRVDDGLIRLQVLEGRVRSLRVTGSRYFSQGYIRNTVAELAPGSVPNFNVVQEQLATLNRTEDRRVQPVLKPGPVPSTVDVELQVKDQLPATASLEVNNRYAPATTPWRLQLALAYNNLWQRSHSFSLTAITAPSNTDQSSLLITSYGMPWADGGSFTGYLVASDSLVQPLNAVTVAGKGLNLGLRWQLPLPPLPNIGHSLQWGLDYKDYETSTVTGELGVFTPLRYLPFTLGYSGGYFEGNQSTTLNTQLVAAQRNLLRRSVDCADAGPADQFACSARNAQGTFSYWRGEVRHSQPVWGASRLGLRLGWQLTSDPLVGNERYAIGGAESVRGYAEAAASGDRAVLLGLQWDSPNLGGKDGWDLLSWFEEARAYAFFEAAEVRILNALPEQPVGTRLRGTGLGLQWRTGRHSNGQLDLAVPLLTQGEDRSGKARLHVRVQVAL
jgi:hemolysin activation/secretion protein